MLWMGDDRTELKGEHMKNLATTAALAALLLAGCAAPGSPASGGNASAANGQDSKEALDGEAQVLRSKIVQLKEQVVVFEVMLTDVERRAAMTKTVALRPANVGTVPVVAQTRPDSGRLSVTVRPSTGESPPAKPVPKKKVNKDVRRK
ncbi:MAG: hypothetical protein JWR68_2954 [Polaromonas sp.]|nr:hypothetical protein [Polaromonas sp.]